MWVTILMPIARPCAKPLPSARAAAGRLVFGDGSEDLIKILCEVFLAPGDLVVTQRPVFGLHMKSIQR